MLFLVATLYAAYSLCSLIFAVLLSDLVTLPAAYNVEALFLPNNLLLWLSYLGVVIVLLFLSVKPERWNVHGGTVQPSNYPPSLSRQKDLTNN